MEHRYPVSGPRNLIRNKVDLSTVTLSGEEDEAQRDETFRNHFPIDGITNHTYNFADSGELEMTKAALRVTRSTVFAPSVPTSVAELRNLPTMQYYVGGVNGDALIKYTLPEGAHKLRYTCDELQKYLQRRTDTPEFYGGPAPDARFSGEKDIPFYKDGVVYSTARTARRPVCEVTRMRVVVSAKTMRFVLEPCTLEQCEQESYVWPEVRIAAVQRNSATGTTKVVAPTPSMVVIEKNEVCLAEDFIARRKEEKERQEAEALSRAVAEDASSTSYSDSDDEESQIVDRVPLKRRAPRKAVDAEESQELDLVEGNPSQVFAPRLQQSTTAGMPAKRAKSE